MRCQLYALAALSGLASAAPKVRDSDAWKKNIKNVVILVEENRSFDEFVGGLSYSSDINGLVNRQYCNPM